MNNWEAEHIAKTKRLVGKMMLLGHKLYSETKPYPDMMYTCDQCHISFMVSHREADELCFINGKWHKMPCNYATKCVDVLIEDVIR